MIEKKLYDTITAAEKILAQFKHDALWRLPTLRLHAPYNLPRLKSYIEDVELLLKEETAKDLPEVKCNCNEPPYDNKCPVHGW